ncbi:MAG: ABC transporter permease [Promethearchaeota archaeon]
MSLIKYIARRLLLMVPIVLGVLTLTFVLSRFLPGDPVLASLPKYPAPELVEAKRREMGLYDPMIVQYFRYLWDVFSGNWGRSLTVAPYVEVTDYLRQVVPRTFQLAIFPVILSSIIGVKVGVYSARYRNKPQDTIIRGIAVAGVAVPVFWMGLLFQYFLGYRLGNFTGGVFQFPVVGFKNARLSDPPLITGFRLIDCFLADEPVLLFDTIMHLILPVTCLTIISIASITRQTRSSMLEVMEQDYIRTARAKGCAENEVINKHALRNALIPTATVIGFSLAGLLTGAVLTETTFNIEGLGMGLVSAIQTDDYWVINGIVLVVAIIFVLSNLAVDIAYAIIDPRIKYT